MKPLTSCLAAISLFAAWTPLDAAEEKQPTFRQNATWIIISGNAEDGGSRGALPWTYAFRKSTVTSVCIETDWSRVEQTGSPEQKRFHGASDAEIQAMPAFIEITTTERVAGGEYKRYRIAGLTHATAQVMLNEVLESVPGSKKRGGGE